MDTVAVKLTGPEDMMPHYGTEDSAGADLRACVDSPVTLAPGERKLIPTGLRMAIPSGYEGQVRPRSGLAVKKGLTVLNTPGTIDADYRGDVMVILINLGREDVVIERGERIAQLIIAPVTRADFQFTDNLEDTARGSGGFGSTGVK
ncbi:MULTISPECIES: dUTP diphosphatase [unclassified Oceanispirochaeta]|uniref:dUTP diphosphatase n=1 Tax=unclassified Oceanispirochaeta TaxID=2635722 RepID=UPI000E09020B|nr:MULTISPECIES: dUTP diphosphatase [unclassified Oceanispirochaeta]MBF9017240.1 dUTP diphosphatase [Oceanispirochaeta sp. M2]NPD73689.1 dUTP diphosphatase [Oceanispirochaeta sp. M1]RDG30617.1 dUTP diphosphatase [Oceanispirochaeta sp. M1]